MTTRLLAAALFATASLPLPVQAQEYPSRPVTVVVPAAPGGTTDFTGRLIADGLSKALNQRFIVENRGGANGNVGNAAVARAAPDGYTLLAAYSGYQVTNPAIYTNLTWDPIKDFAPVALAVKAPHVLVVKKDLPVKDLKEFVAYLKANPGKLSYGSAGIGSIPHIGGALFGQLTGTEMVHVPYRGTGPAMNDLIAGNIEVFITTPTAAVGHIESGNAKALALAATERHPVMPNVPTAAEAGVAGFDLTAWFALYAPAGTPKPIIDRLAAEAERIVQSPEFKARVEQQGAYAAFMGPAELGAFTKRELDHWGPVLKGANIKVE